MIEAHNEVRTTFSFLTSQRSRGAEGEADHEQRPLQHIHLAALNSHWVMLDVGTTGSGSLRLQWTGRKYHSDVEVLLVAEKANTHRTAAHLSPSRLAHQKGVTHHLTG